jgi:DNA-binding NtrC family response regulator
MIVEDDAVILAMAKTMLQSLGYNVKGAGSAQEALEMSVSTTEEIALLITDVVMPNMNGKELATLMQKQRPSLKCLFMSGYTADVITNRGVLDEGIRFVQKPFTLTGLATKVRGILDDSAADSPSD